MISNKNNVQSFYNEGFFQIQRLNNLWFEANNKSRTGNVEQWRWVLDVVWRELSRDILKQESKNDKANDKELYWYKENDYFKMREEHQKKIKIAKGEFKKTGNKENYYLALNDYEIFLRYLQDAFGKGGKYIDPDEHGID